MRTSLFVIVLTLVGWAATEQATAQVTSSPPPGIDSPSQGTESPPQARGPHSRGTVSHHGTVTVVKVPSTAAQMGVGIDFVNAKALALPGVSPRSELAAQYDLMDALRAQPALGEPGSSASGLGHGSMSPMHLGVPNSSAAQSDLEVTPQEFGTNNHPFSTSQADLFATPTNTSYPYRAAGKLFFNIGNSTFLCSASLIKRGVVVTAAHCVANFGQRQFYSNWQFVPGYRNGSAPFGVWTARSATVLTSYYNGTDPCAVSGVVCQDDVAVLLLNPSPAGAYAGTATGWYGYGFNGYGFTGGGLTQITQLGYPVCLDNGVLMERNDSYGYTSSSNSNNTIIGSLMCGGSSGGPWLVNFGNAPVLTGTIAGTYPDHNLVVGVTSWGYTSTGPKEQGASPFTSANIVVLVNTVCASVPAACS